MAAYWTYPDGEVPMYRIGTSDRVIGAATGAPDGFMLLNQTNNNTFVASGGVWMAGGAFPADVLAAWYVEDVTDPPPPWAPLSSTPSTSSFQADSFQSGAFE